MRFAAIGLDHRHIYDLTAGLIEAGRRLRGLLAADERPARAEGLSGALS